MMYKFEVSIVVIFVIGIISYIWGFYAGYRVNKKRADDYMTTIKSLVLNNKALKESKNI